MQKLPPSQNNPRKLLALTALSYMMELYDWVLYGVMIPVMAYKFFPDNNFQMLLAFVGFALSFLVVPFGAAFWGWYGDKFGGLLMQDLAMKIMAISSLFIAMLPTYEQIGIAASILLLLLRLMQGMSISSRAGMKIFIMQMMDEKQHGIASGILTAAGAMGVLLAVYMGYLNNLSKLDYFWRLSFALSGILIVIARIIRLSVLKHMPLPKNKALVQNSWQIMWQNKKAALTVFMLGAMLGAFSYTMHVFINPFLVKNGFDKKLVYQYAIAGYSATIICAILAGMYIDKCYREKFLQSLKYVMLGNIIFVLPLLIGILHGKLFLYFMLDGLLGIYACMSGVMIYRIFPQDIRFRGVMLSYSFGSSVFGGMIPMVLNAVGEINIYLAPGVLLVFFIIAFLVFNRNIKDITLHTS